MYIQTQLAPESQQGMGILPVLIIGGVTAVGAAAAWWQIKEEEEYQQFKKETERTGREALKTPPTPLPPPPGTVYQQTVGVTPDGQIWTPERTIDPLAFREWWRTRAIGTPDVPANGSGAGGVSPWLVVGLIVGGVAAVKAIRG